ncbi:MAG: hypothetical protein ABI597_03550 [Gammaproteobacteria bacterium]
MFAHLDREATDPELATFFSDLDKEPLDSSIFSANTSTTVPPSLFDESYFKEISLSFKFPEHEEPPLLPLILEPTVKANNLEDKIAAPIIEDNASTETTVPETKSIPTEMKIDIPALRQIANQLEILAQNSSYKGGGKLEQLLKSVTKEKDESHSSRKAPGRKRKKSSTAGSDSDCDQIYGGSKRDKNARSAQNYRTKKKSHEMSVSLILINLAAQLKTHLYPESQPNNEEKQNPTVTNQKSLPSKKTRGPKRSDRLNNDSSSSSNPASPRSNSSSPSSSDSSGDTSYMQLGSTARMFKPVIKFASVKPSMSLGKTRSNRTTI